MKCFMERHDSSLSAKILLKLVCLEAVKQFTPKSKYIRNLCCKQSENSRCLHSDSRLVFYTRRPRFSSYKHMLSFESADCDTSIQTAGLGTVKVQANFSIDRGRHPYIAWTNNMCMVQDTVKPYHFVTPIVCESGTLAYLQLLLFAMCQAAHVGHKAPLCFCTISSFLKQCSMFSLLHGTSVLCLLHAWLLMNHLLSKGLPVLNWLVCCIHNLVSFAHYLVSGIAQACAAK